MGMFFLTCLYSFFLSCSDSYILHLSRGGMSKLILVLCLFGIAVLAKPSRLQAKTDVRQMDEGNCTNPKTGKKMEVQWRTNPEYACVKGVGYSCEERIVGATFQNPWGEGSEGRCYRTCPQEWNGYTWKSLVHDDNVDLPWNEALEKKWSYVKCDYKLPRDDPQLHLQCVVENKKTYPPCK